MSHPSLRILLVAGFVLAAWIPLASAQTEITSCGQVVTGPAFLSADLDCTGYDGESVVSDFGHAGVDWTIQGAAVVISKKGTLELRGHTITASMLGVFCAKSCTVLGGGGTVTAASVHAVVAGKDLTIRDTTISSSGEVALFVNGVLSATGCMLTGNHYGTWFGKKVKLVDSTVTGTAEFAVTGNALTVVDSTLFGNGIDLVSTRRPKLKNSTCETSSWGEDHLDVCGAP